MVLSTATGELWYMMPLCDVISCIEDTSIDATDVSASQFDTRMVHMTSPVRLLTMTLGIMSVYGDCVSSPKKVQVVLLKSPSLVFKK